MAWVVDTSVVVDLVIHPTIAGPAENRLGIPPSEARMTVMLAVTEIMQDVLKLPRTERSFLAKKLLESLEADETFGAEELEEFERRSRQTRDGSVKPLTLEQLQQDVSARLA